jgi:hypothetical protein
MANEKSFKEAWKCDQERFTCDIVVGFAFVRLMLNNFFTYERSCAVRVREREREKNSQSFARIFRGLNFRDNGRTNPRRSASNINRM